MDQQLNYDLPLVENITWQYDEASNLIGLVDAKGNWYANNWKGFWEGWYTSIFNLKTANRFGCVVWAIILDVPVELVYSPPTSRTPFGTGPYRENFDNANFFIGGSAYTLTLEEARKILRIRYYAQTMSTTVSNINWMLRDVFSEDGLAFIEETVGGAAVPSFGFGPYHQNFNAPSNFNTNPLFINIKPMVQRYIFTFDVSVNVKLALKQYLPRGSGVQTQLLKLDRSPL